MQEKRLKYKDKPIEEDTPEGVSFSLILCRYFYFCYIFSIKKLFGRLHVNYLLILNDYVLRKKDEKLTNENVKPKKRLNAKNELNYAKNGIKTMK